MTTLSISYVGNHGVHIPVNNEGLNAFGAGFSPFPDTVPTPIFGTFQQYSSSGISNYNGITSSVVDASDPWLVAPVQLYLEPCHG